MLCAFVLVGLAASPAAADDLQAGSAYAGFASGSATVETVNVGTGEREIMNLELTQGIWDSSFPACLPDSRCPLVPTAMTLNFIERFVSNGQPTTSDGLILAGRAETGTFVTAPDGDLYVGVSTLGISRDTWHESRMGGQCTVTIGGSFEQGLSGSVECARLGPGLQGDFVDVTGTFSTTPGVAPPTASAPVVTSSPAAFGVGIGCGVREDAGLRLLACTASPFGQAADAVLAYQWRLDGVTRVETGSTMQVDIVRENLPAGNHAIGVTVTDTRNNVQATNGASVDTTTAAFAVSLACTYGESQGTYELSCAAAVTNPPQDADLTYTWTVNGAPVGTTGERLTRSVGQGPVQVTVLARDAVSGQQSNTGSYFLTINPTGTLTNVLTLGQTSDPQNVIDALAGSAAVALVVGAAAAIGGALAGAAGALSGAGAAPSGGRPPPVPASGAAAAPKPGIVGGDVVDSVELVAQIIPEPPWAPPEAAPTAQSATAPTGPGQSAQPVDSAAPTGGVPGVATPADVEDLRLIEELLTSSGGGSPGAGAALPSAGASPPTTGTHAAEPPTIGVAETAPADAQIAEGVGDLLAAEAGHLPAPNDVEKWRTLSGMPDTPEGTLTLNSYLSQLAILQTAGKNPDANVLLEALRERASALRSKSDAPEK